RPRRPIARAGQSCRIPRGPTARRGGSTPPPGDAAGEPPGGRGRGPPTRGRASLASAQLVGTQLVGTQLAGMTAPPDAARQTRTLRRPRVRRAQWPAGGRSTSKNQSSRRLAVRRTGCRQGLGLTRPTLARAISAVEGGDCANRPAARNHVAEIRRCQPDVTRDARSTTLCNARDAQSRVISAGMRYSRRVIDVERPSIRSAAGGSPGRHEATTSRAPSARSCTDPPGARHREQQHRQHPNPLGHGLLILSRLAAWARDSPVEGHAPRAG
ncbi:MAG: hypothetical protein QOG60_2154, partial [Frankiaceae bacterium]|nr:hypothetical protein [Frankiaceae bacterium]